MNLTAPPALPRLPAGAVMAEVDGQPITAGDLDAALAEAPGEVRYEYTAPEAVAELVQSLVDRKLMAAAARRDGLVATGAAGAPAEYQLADAWQERELGKLPPPAEADVSRYYREHQSEFTEPQRVFVTRVVAVSETAAERIRLALTKKATLDELHTDHAADIRSADQVWVQDSPRAPQLNVVALALEPGGVSAVQAAGEDSIVLRAEQKKERRVRPLAEVRAGIVSTLDARARAEASAALTRELRRNVRITLNEDAIDSYSAASAPRSP